MIDFDERIPIPSTPEKDVYREIEEGLQKIGWEKLQSIKENQLIPGFILTDVFENIFKRINEPHFRDLNEKEKNEILTYVKERLKSDDERAILRYLKYGVEYYVHRISSKRVFRLIYYGNLKENVFLFAPQVKFEGSPENTKPDFTLFINGIPIVVIEAKSKTKSDSFEEAVRQIRRYEEESPELFRYVQLGVAYGDRQVYLPTKPNRSHEKVKDMPFSWKVERQDGSKADDIFELLKPETLLNVLRWYTFYFKDGRSKVIVRYNQFYASEKALHRISEYLDYAAERNRGLVWHWQGSGKTYTMIFTANKFFETYFHRNPVVFFVVDREDLQKQLVEDFISKLDATVFESNLKKIESIDELKSELEEIKRSVHNPNVISRKIYVVLIQKFRKRDFEEFLSKESAINKREVVFLIDEAHRSQYGTLASVTKNIFPQAVRFAFTGTPVFKYEERNTFMEFGYSDEPYMHVYFIQDSVDDGFTVPIVYDIIEEKKGAEKEEGIRILLKDEDIRRFIEDWGKITEEEYEDALEGRVTTITKNEVVRHLDSIRVILSNENRIKKLASYIAQRIKEDTENFRYKAMVVMVNREACVKMKRHLDAELSKAFAGEDTQSWTEVVMTYEQNDVGDILKYKEELRKKYAGDYDEINKAIQDKFKKDEHPRILIVTDMLITGFDAPRLRVMYLDKPLYDHRLLQAIARVNRPYEDLSGEKKYGVIVDSVGLLTSLKKSVESYELLADKRLSAELLKNVFCDVNKKAESFKQNLQNLKEELKNLRYLDEDFSFDVDKLKAAYRNDRALFEKLVQELIDLRIRRMALYWDVVDIMKKMHEVIEEFKALGAHRDRVHYEDDIMIINYIYTLLLRRVSGQRMPKEFWKQFVDFIHSKTLVSDFEKIAEYRIEPKEAADLKQAIDVLNGELKEEEVADAYSILRSFLLENISNPIYKVIHERLEKLRVEWVRRNLDLSSLREQMKELAETAENYRKDMENKPFSERIIETVKYKFKLRFGNGTLELEDFSSALKEVERAKIIGEKEWKRLNTALLKGLMKTSNSPKALAKFSEEIVDYVVGELKKERK